jgi:signal transduction histidine kinase
MKSLFARVLALLLGSFLVVALVSSLLFKWVTHELNPHEQHFQELSRDVAEEVIERYEAGESRNYSRKLKRRFNAKAWILDAGNNPVSEDGPPGKVLSQVNSYPLTIFPHQNSAGKFFIFAHEISADTRTYKVILTSHRPKFGSRNQLWFVWFPIAIVLLGLAGASVLLSYWVLRPINIIRKTSREISENNFNSRIPAVITRRGDAFGELGRDFNHMTERVQATVENQEQLLRDVSHELRTPLARIQVAASLVEQKTGSRPELDRIESEVDTLNNLIEDLLSLSRLKNQAELEQRPVELVDLISSVIGDAEFEFQQSGKSVTLTAEESVTVYGNGELLASMLENIIRNGLRYAPDDTALKVDLFNKEGSAIISVADSGPGVDPADLERIFDAFYRADKSRDVSGGHHGIGLALAKTIVQTHKGNISASNIPDGGLEIRIELPLLS